MKVLVTGFGPFPGVDDNPTAALARAVDGVRLGDAELVGRVLPVAWRRGPEEAIRLARELDAGLVLGLGVAANRDRVCVEVVGVRVDSGRPDVDGATEPGLDGPDRVRSTIEVGRLAAALGAVLSDDAGGYVCNAWLYRVASALTVPVGFVHVPAAGLPPDLLLDGLRALLARPGAPPR